MESISVPTRPGSLRSGTFVPMPVHVLNLPQSSKSSSDAQRNGERFDPMPAERQADSNDPGSSQKVRRGHREPGRGAAGVASVCLLEEELEGELAVATSSRRQWRLG